MKRFLLPALIVAMLPLLGGCGGGGLGLGAQRLSPPSTPQPKPGRATTIVAAYVNTGGNSGGLAFFSATANGNVTPEGSVTGHGGSFTTPLGLAQDSSSNLYVLDKTSSGSYQVVKLAEGNEGGSPLAIISGSSTGMVTPTHIAADGAGDVFVADSATNSILTYQSGSNGNTPPERTLSGANTLIGTPAGLAADPTNNVYITTGESVLGFDPSLSGNVAPTRILAGVDTGLDGPGPLTFRSDGAMYVETTKGAGSYPQIEIFTYLETDNVPPELELGGITTQLTVPTALALDAGDFIYVGNLPFGVTTANCNGSKILVFEPGANGDRAPVAVISGSNTQLGCITGLVVR
jgi:hypothetical protein